MVSRSVQKAQTRDAILRAAAIEFSERGYAAATFSGIAARMGRPKSALGYNHFPSKLSMAHAIIERQAVRWRDVIASGDAVPTGIPRLLSVLLTTAIDSRADPLAAAAVQLLLDARSADDLDLPPLGFRWRDYCVAEAASAIENGQFGADADAEDIVQKVLNASFGLFASENRGLQNMDTEHALTELWTTLLPGLGGRDTARVMSLVRVL